MVVIVPPGMELTKFPSIAECARTLGYTKDTVNWRVRTRGKVIHKDGLRFMFEEDVDDFLATYNPNETPVLKQKSKTKITIKMKNVKTGEILQFESISSLSSYIHVSKAVISRWLKEKNQPVLPGLIQLKYADDTSPWRKVIDPIKELSDFTKVKIILNIDRDGVTTFFSSPVECCKARDITPTCLLYRLRSKGTILFQDGYRYMFYEDANSPVS